MPAMKKGPDAAKGGRATPKKGLREASKTEDGKGVSATARTVAILEALAQSGYTSLEPLAQKVGIAKPTLFRFLKTLKGLGYVIQHDDTRYSLSLKMFNVGSQALASMDLYETAKPIVKRLSDAIGETVHLAVMVDESVVYIMKMESKYTIRMYSTIGKQAPLYCTALGKAMLAWNPDREAIVSRIKFSRHTERSIVSAKALKRELDITRKRGYAIDAEEHEDNIHCIGAPVFDYTGQVTAAISVSWPVFRYDLSREPAWAEVIMAAAREISSLLGHAT